jgi:hypothetical protein
VSNTVTHKQTASAGSRCDGCGLWFEYLHPTADDRRFLCRMCLEVSGANRSAVGRRR